MLDILIRGGLVIDGTGSTGRLADVGIIGERVVEVGPLPDATARQVIDAAGLVVAPGFIDPHSHSDFTLLANPEFQSTIRQGVTTEVVGNCGLGVAPVTQLSRKRVSARLAEYAWDDGATWSSFDEHLAVVERVGTSANTAWLIGHNALRDAAGVVGPDITADQLLQMERWLEDGMEAGALGMSTGLEFEPGRLAGHDELQRLVTTIGRRGGLYASHIRNRDERLQEAVDECLGLARAGDARCQISHLNVRHNTGAAPGAWEAAVATVERARAEGLDVMADATPMTSGDGVAAALLPPWLMADGPTRASQLLTDPDVRQRVRADGDRYWRFVHRGEWHRVRLLSSAEYPELCSLTFPEIATRLGTDEWDAFLEILRAAGEHLESVAIVGELFSEEMSAATVAHPLFLLGADTMTTTVDGPLSRQTRHPLHFAGHVHFLTHHVRERSTLSLEAAVRKMTSLVAERFGLADRGTLRAGAAADVVVFDFEHLADVSTVAEPLAYVKGVEHVLVNGAPVVKSGAHTGARAGRALRRT